MTTQTMKRIEPITERKNSVQYPDLIISRDVFLNMGYLEHMEYSGEFNVDLEELTIGKVKNDGVASRVKKFKRECDDKTAILREVRNYFIHKESTKYKDTKVAIIEDQEKGVFAKGKFYSSKFFTNEDLLKLAGNNYNLDGGIGQYTVVNRPRHGK